MSFKTFTCSIFLLLLATSISFACVGDCTACHSNIVGKDGNLTKGHEALGKCKICHTDESLENLDMGEAACGQDCWECHSPNKVINSGVKEHEVLAVCKDCHRGFNNSVFSTIKDNQNSLKSILDKR